MTQPPDAPTPGPGGQLPPPPWGAPAPQGWGQPQQQWGPALPQPGPAGYAVPPKPGVVPLRPLGLSDVFDGSFRTMRRNPAATIGQAVLLQLIVGAFTLLAMGPARSIILDPTLLAEDQNLDAFADSGIWLGISVLLGGVLATFAFLLTQMLCTAPTLRAILNLHTPLPLAWRLSKGGIGRLLLLCLLFLALWVAGLGLWVGATYLGYVAVSGFAATMIALLGGLVFTVGATFLSVRLLFAPAAIVAESLGALASLKRSWVLTRGSWWRMFGILLLCSLVVGVAVSVLSTPLSILGGVAVPLMSPGNPGEMGPAVQAILLLTYGVSYLSAGLGAGYLAVVASLLYADLRIRREGMDVVLMAESDAGFNEGIPGNTPLPAQAHYPGAGFVPPGYGASSHPPGPVPPPWDTRPR